MNSRVVKFVRGNTMVGVRAFPEQEMAWNRWTWFFLLLSTILLVAWCSPLWAKGGRMIKEQWRVHPHFAHYRPTTVAIMPMDNLTYQEAVAEQLYQAVYNALPAKGYLRISVREVMTKMKRLGVKVPGQLAGISPARLGRELHCDALLMGRVDQCEKIHDLVYDAIVVSLSLKLVDCRTGRILWETEQWRTAHRQWAGDPVNMLINLAVHQAASYEKRIRYLVSEMLRTLPSGPVVVKQGMPLLEQAVTVESEAK